MNHHGKRDAKPLVQLDMGTTPAFEAGGPQAVQMTSFHDFDEAIRKRRVALNDASGPTKVNVACGPLELGLCRGAALARALLQQFAVQS